MKINTDYTFEEINKFIGQSIIAYSDIDKGVEYKFMKDESMKDIQAIILQYNGPYYERYTLIIKYLDKSLVRCYNYVIFTDTSEKTFEYIYEKCKENDYIDYKFDKH